MKTKQLIIIMMLQSNLLKLNIQYNYQIYNHWITGHKFSIILHMLYSKSNVQ